MPINHYESLARHYRNLRIINKDKACLHLEHTNDKAFWEPFFLKFFPRDSFHYITYSKSELGNDTTGCEQCLKYKPYLDKYFLICIDSDYRYLHQESNIDIQHFIFQTYTYSFENHLCHERGFNTTCKASSNFDNLNYNFSVFMTKFSFIIYELFIWHMALHKNNSADFEKDEFLNILAMGSLVANKQQDYLTELKDRVDSKLASLQQAYPAFNLSDNKSYYDTLGIKNDNVYLYIRGHNLFSMYQKIANNICDFILATEKKKLGNNTSSIKKLYSNRKSISEVISNNIFWGTYPEINKIEADMSTFASF